MLQDFFKFGQKCRASRKPKNIIARVNRLAALYQINKNEKTLEQLYILVFPYIVRLLKNENYRQGFALEECHSEAFIILERAANKYEYGCGVYFITYYSMRLRGHLSNIKKKEMRDLCYTKESYEKHEEYLDNIGIDRFTITEDIIIE